MGAEYPNDWRNAAASALSWWESAGVDTLVEGDARDWCLPADRAIPAAAAPEGISAPEAPMPAALEPFRAWRTSDLVPEATWFAPRIAPTGPANAPLMILTDMPEPDDRAKLFEDGPVARLLDNILSAIGMNRETVHLAALCVARPDGGRVPPEAQTRLARIARHHVELAAPRRLLVFGQATQALLFGADARRGGLQTLNQGSAELPAIATFHPRALIERPEWKAIVWRDLQTLLRGHV